MPKNNKREWTREELEDIKELHEQGYENMTIAEKYHCHWSTICRLTRNKKDETDFVFKKIYGEFPTPNEKKQFLKYKLELLPYIHAKVNCQSAKHAIQKKK